MRMSHVLMVVATLSRTNKSSSVPSVYSMNYKRNNNKLFKIDTKAR